jgi:hypothetical protein
MADEDGASGKQRRSYKLVVDPALKVVVPPLAHLARLAHAQRHCQRAPDARSKRCGNQNIAFSPFALALNDSSRRSLLLLLLLPPAGRTQEGVHLLRPREPSAQGSRPSRTNHTHALPEIMSPRAQVHVGAYPTPPLCFQRYTVPCRARQHCAAACCARTHVARTHALHASGEYPSVHVMSPRTAAPIADTSFCAFASRAPVPAQKSGARKLHRCNRVVVDRLPTSMDVGVFQDLCAQFGQLEELQFHGGGSARRWAVVIFHHESVATRFCKHHSGDSATANSALRAMLDPGGKLAEWRENNASNEDPQPTVMSNLLSAHSFDAARRSISGSTDGHAAAATDTYLASSGGGGGDGGGGGGAAAHSYGGIDEDDFSDDDMAPEKLAARSTAADLAREDMDIDGMDIANSPEPEPPTRPASLSPISMAIAAHLGTLPPPRVAATAGATAAGAITTNAQPVAGGSMVTPQSGMAVAPTFVSPPTMQQMPPKPPPWGLGSAPPPPPPPPPPQAAPPHGHQPWSAEPIQVGPGRFLPPPWQAVPHGAVVPRAHPAPTVGGPPIGPPGPPGPAGHPGPPRMGEGLAPPPPPGSFVTRLGGGLTMAPAQASANSSPFTPTSAGISGTGGGGGSGDGGSGGGAAAAGKGRWDVLPPSSAANTVPHPHLPSPMAIADAGGGGGGGGGVDQAAVAAAAVPQSGRSGRWDAVAPMPRQESSHLAGLRIVSRLPTRVHEAQIRGALAAFGPTRVYRDRDGHWCLLFATFGERERAYLEDRVLRISSILVEFERFEQVRATI